MVSLPLLPLLFKISNSWSNRVGLVSLLVIFHNNVAPTVGATLLWNPNRNTAAAALFISSRLTDAATNHSRCAHLCHFSHHELCVLTFWGVKTDVSDLNNRCKA